MKIVALTPCTDDQGVVHYPNTENAEFDLPNKMAESLIEIKAACKPSDVPEVTPLVGVSQFGEAPIAPVIEAKPTK